METLRFIRDNLYIAKIAVAGGAVCLPAFRSFPETEIAAWIIVSVAFFATLIMMFVLGVTGVCDEDDGMSSDA